MQGKGARCSGMRAGRIECESRNPGKRIRILDRIYRMIRIVSG